MGNTDIYSTQFEEGRIGVAGFADPNNNSAASAKTSLDSLFANLDKSTANNTPIRKEAVEKLADDALANGDIDQVTHDKVVSAANSNSPVNNQHSACRQLAIWHSETNCTF